MYTSPADIGKDFSKNAIQKSSQSLQKTFLYSVVGGAFISFGGLLAIVVAGGMPGVYATNPGIVKFLFGAVFPVGLIMIVIGGAQLFTSDCAVLPHGALNKKVSWTNVVKTWGIVYVGNFIGALLIAYGLAIQGGLLDNEPWKTFTVNIAITKTSASFLKIFTKAIGANWLVCMAVWMSYAAKDVTGKILAMWFPVMCFVVLGLEYSIANMFFIPTAQWLGGNISLYNFFVKNLLPATLGNIVGGFFMVAVVYWRMFPQTAKPTVTKDTRQQALKDFEKRLN